MKIEITRHGLRITPTNQPMDDIIIEDKLGLYREGDFVKLIRVSGSELVSEKQFLAEAPPSYILKTDLDICPVLTKTEAVLACDKTGETPPLTAPTPPTAPAPPTPFVGYPVETARQISARDESWESKDETTPLPCPFCGAYPEIKTLDGDDPGIIYGKIVCLNPQCPVQPEICDDRGLPGSVDEESFRSALISQWNTRPANAG